MDPSTMPVAPAQPTPQAAAPSAPIYQDKVWYFPEGIHTVFAARPGLVQVYPGWLLVIDGQTNLEVRRTPLTAMNKYGASFGVFRFKELNGQKTGKLDSGSMLYAYNPKFAMLSNLFAYFAIKRAKVLRQAVEQAAR